MDFVGSILGLRSVVRILAKSDTLALPSVLNVSYNNGEVFPLIYTL
jgi:hypothetical protein